MRKIKLTLLVALLLCFVTKSFSQHRSYDIHNGIDITAAITKFNISTDNFITKENYGFFGSFAGMLDVSHRWYNISFGLQFSENKLGVSGRPTMLSTEEEDIDFKLLSVQAALLLHIKFLEYSRLTLDVGPAFQYNDKLQLKKTIHQSYYINGYDNLLANDIRGISQLNFNGIAGVSAGYRAVSLKAHYVYGFNNILEKLNSKELDTSGGESEFKGHLNMLVLGIMFTF